MMLGKLLKRGKEDPGVVAHTCNLGTRDTEAVGKRVPRSLGYTAKPCLTKQKTRKTESKIFPKLCFPHGSVSKALAFLLVVCLFTYFHVGIESKASHMLSNVLPLSCTPSPVLVYFKGIWIRQRGGPLQRVVARWVWTGGQESETSVSATIQGDLKLKPGPPKQLSSGFICNRARTNPRGK
jgi:hypothetical protein